MRPQFGSCPTSNLWISRLLLPYLIGSIARIISFPAWRFSLMRILLGVNTAPISRRRLRCVFTVVNKTVFCHIRTAVNLHYSTQRTSLLLHVVLIYTALTKSYLATVLIALSGFPHFVERGGWWLNTNALLRRTCSIWVDGSALGLVSDAWCAILAPSWSFLILKAFASFVTWNAEFIRTEWRLCICRLLILI